ncbi:hypothetical protein SBV1_170032 [Verrucomicrobia bacterium]|nr:hypothetical protein SBV1_170032 [Verrucomicrobiota bacterium]
MTYRGLLSRLQKITPQQLRQTVKLEEGFSVNVTSLTCFVTAPKDVPQRVVPKHDRPLPQDSRRRFGNVGQGYRGQGYRPRLKLGRNCWLA